MAPLQCDRSVVRNKIASAREKDKVDVLPLKKYATRSKRGR